MLRRRFGYACAFAALLGSLAGLAPAKAQTTFPQPGRPITLIVPYAAGGTTDAAGRILAEQLEKELGTPVQIENRAGAASQVALTALVRSAPDGYTLSYVVIPTVLSHYLDPSRGAIYSRESFQAIAHHHLIPAMIAVKAESPHKTLKQFVEAARATPEKITISDSGLRGNPHLTALMLQQAADVRFSSVHFDGGAPSVAALLGGHVDALAGGVSDAVPHVASGVFRVLGVAANERSPFLPEVPTMKEQGFDVVSVSATGIVAPARTPPHVVAKLSSSIQKIVESEEHKERLRKLGATAHYMNPEQYATFWQEAERRVKSVLDKFSQ
jgi:tripartite-type tricarboxylate transporter receptor subunit TctC